MPSLLYDIIFVIISPVCTQIAAEVAAPLAQCKKVTLVSSGKGDVGAAKLTGEVFDIIERMPKMVESMTGVDLSKVWKVITKSLLWSLYSQRGWDKVTHQVKPTKLSHDLTWPNSKSSSPTPDAQLLIIGASYKKMAWFVYYFKENSLKFKHECKIHTCIIALMHSLVNNGSDILQPVMRADSTGVMINHRWNHMFPKTIFWICSFAVLAPSPLEQV